MMDFFFDRYRRKYPVSSAVGEAVGRKVGEWAHQRQAQAEHQRNLKQFGLSHLDAAAQVTKLLQIAAQEALLYPQQTDPRLAAIGWDVDSLHDCDGYIVVAPEMDAADLANAIVAARQYQAIDEAVRAAAAQLRDALKQREDVHPALADLDFAGCWRGLGHHANGASLNLHQLPEGPYRLNALCYPSLFFQVIGADDADAPRKRVLVDDYPEHAGVMLFSSLAWTDKLDHPLNPLPEANRKRGDRLYAGFAQLGCALDPLIKLPLALSEINGKFHDYRVDIESSTPARYPLRRLGRGIADLRLFNRHRDDIARYLKRDVELAADPDDTNVIYLHDLSQSRKTTVTVPKLLSLTAEHLQPGRLHLGQDLATGDDLWLPLEDFTHTLIAGETGSGKSSWTVSLIEGLRAQEQACAHLYLCDLKQVEFARYADATANITVVDELEALFEVGERVHQTMLARLARAKQAGERNSSEPLIVIVIDEFANLMLMDAWLEAEAKKQHKRLISRLIDMGMRARSANIRLVISLQHPIDKHIPSALKFNCPSKILFRVPSRTYTALMFGDADESLFPTHPRDLLPGQAYWQAPGHPPRLLQGTFPG